MGLNYQASLCGLLVVARRLDKNIDMQDRKFLNELITPSLCIELKQQYMGFDGDVWPGQVELPSFVTEEALPDWNILPKVIEYFEKSRKQSVCNLIYITIPDAPVLATGHSVPLEFLGYDYGNFISAYNYFSSILNEIVFGWIEDMQYYQSYLNKYLLFSEIAIIEQLHTTRERLSKEEKGLETVFGQNEVFGPIAIYRIY